MTQKRKTFDEIYMDLAVDLSARSTCARTSVGCAIVSMNNTRVLSIGYNGSWQGGPNSCDSDEPGNCGCLHAEDNALIKSNYSEVKGAKAYITLSPCAACAKRFINAGIAEVIYLSEYRKKDGIEVLKKAGIKVSQIVDGNLQVK